jgi:hypothetical protein
MGFKLTYRDGQEDDYDDGTEWAVEGGVLKMGREAGKWTVLVSPSHWATIEIDRDKDTAKDQAQEEDNDQAQSKTKDTDEDQDLGAD